MATKKPAPKKKPTSRKVVPRKKDASSDGAESTKPKFAYTTKPNSLRKFLELIPQKPKPQKVNAATLKAWDLRDTNDTTIIRVLKALGLVGSNNEPTARYTEYMTPGVGPSVLGKAVKEVWAPLFGHAHEPHREDDAKLRNLFNIHSGGGDRTIGYQIQTFRAACDHADFSGESQIANPTGSNVNVRPSGVVTANNFQNGGAATLHIDLHIHLPENKSRRDYEYIFEDIAKYIFGRDVGARSGE